MSTKYSKCNSFKVTSDLLNSENLKVAIAQLWKELHVCNFTMLHLSAPTVTELYNTMYNTTDGINIIIIIMQLYLCTILKGIYI